MAMGKWFLCAALVLSSGPMLIAADEPATQPAPATQPVDSKPARAKKLTLPWSLLKDLTPEQTEQIEKIHSEAAEQTRKIEVKENDDINALLTPDQQTELKAAVAKHKKDEAAGKQHKKEAATQPA